MKQSWDGLLLSHARGEAPFFLTPLSPSFLFPSMTPPHLPDTAPINASHFLKGQALGQTDVGAGPPQ